MLPFKLLGVIDPTEERFRTGNLPIVNYFQINQNIRTLLPILQQ